MHRVFLPQQVPPGQETVVDEEDAHHLQRVLRLRPGDAIWLSDGEGYEAAGRISRMDRSGVWVRVEEAWQAAAGEPRLPVFLAQAVCKADRMDWLIQKATELGVYEIIPLISERVVVRLEKGSKAEARQHRWQRIAREAARQTHRGRIPRVSAPVPFREALQRLARAEGMKGVIPWEVRPELSLPQWLAREAAAPQVCIFIGPEGGWAEDEVAEAVKWGIEPVSLGPRVLRTETAGVVALTLVMAWWGDLQ